MPFDTIIEGKLTGASAAARNNFERAVWCYNCLCGDPLTLLDEVIADSPGFVMAYVLKGHMLANGSNADCVAMAAQLVAEVEGLPMNAHEQAHVAALAKVTQGKLHSAARILEDICIDHPTDLVALEAGQMIDFLLGDSRMLRDRLARALPHWSRDMPGYHAVLGMYAFGLEEMGHYGRAEAAGREAVELEPRNSWAQHAVAHVLEMQGRRREGIAWMNEDVSRWADDNFFKIHNWWHLALFHLGLGEAAEAVRIFDEHIAVEPSEMAFDNVDASAMLWRLMLAGVEVDDRWQPIADSWAKFASRNDYAFSDAHAVMAFVGAGRKDLVAEVQAAQRAALLSDSDNALFVGSVGLDVVAGLVAFGEGDYGATTDRLRRVRNRSARFGGSNAQRDLIDLTIIAAAERGGDERLAQALKDERRLAHPNFGMEADLLIV